MKEYPHEFEHEGAHGRALQLLSDAGLTDGVLLDLGCASGPLAEPVAKLGLEYVGLDIDRHALDDLERRGFDAHQLDLAGDEDSLVAALESVLGDRPLAGVLLLDVVEHLVDPAPLLQALARLDARHGGIALVVSIPNVTHVDVGIKLLLGRWDLTTIGLLDDTHVRFFNERLVRETMMRAGWVEVEAADVVNAFSDQLFPADAPALRPGTPLRQLLWRVRMSADPYGETYQYVRRYGQNPTAAAEAVRPTPAADAAPVFLSVIVRSTDAGLAALDRLIRDVDDQTDGDVEVLVTRESGADDADPRVSVLPSGQDAGWRDAAVGAARGRYVVFLDDTTRLAPSFVAEVRRADAALPGRLVSTAVAAAPRAVLDAARDRGFAEVLDDATAVDLEPLDLATLAPFGSLVLAAHAVPREACATNGLRFAAGDDPAAPSLFLVRAAELCGIVRMGECVSVVDQSTVRDLVSDLPFVAHELDKAPMVLPEGAGTQVLELRRAVGSLSRDRDDLTRQLADANGQVESLSWLLRNRDDELTRLAGEVEVLHGRLAERVRRRVGRALRRG